MCDEDTANSVARVAAVAQVTVGYFENTVAGKITEPWVAFFLECTPGNFRMERRL